MVEQALSDLNVVEWGDFIAAPFCAKNLADMGAKVIKIETPYIGDRARDYGPFLDNIPDKEKSGLFLYLNMNKMGITLNPNKETGRELFVKLLLRADVFVHDRPLAVLKNLNLDFDSLKTLNPKLIMISISPFGQSGPYCNWKGYGINTCALGGISMASGLPSREPIMPPGAQEEYQAGLIAAVSSMVALFERDISEEGLHIDLSISECWATFHTGIGIQAYLEDQVVKKRSGHHALHRPYPDEVVPCKDGYVCIDTPQNRQWARFLNVMGNPEWSKDPIFKDRVQTTDVYVDKADAYLSEWLMQHTKKEIFELCQANDVPAAPIKTIDEVVNDQHLGQRKYFVDVQHPSCGSLKYPGVPYLFSETPFTVKRPAPRLGEHNEEVYCKHLGMSVEELVALRRTEVI